MKTREELTQHLNYIKHQIITSNILLFPRFSKVDSVGLDMIIDAAANIMMKTDDQINDMERKIMRTLGTLTNAAFAELMKTDEVLMNKIYDNMISMDGDRFSDTIKKHVKKSIKDGLIAHEQYEKIKALDEII